MVGRSHVRSVPPGDAASWRGRMMPTMIEDGVDALVTRFKAHATDVEVVARFEGSPLLECLAGDIVLQLFERTGPYLARSGSVRVIVQPEAATWERLPSDDPAPVRSLEVVGVSAIHASGVVVRRDDPFLVIDAGIALVVACASLDAEVTSGDRVRFESRSPIHGFVLPQSRTGAQIATDDLV